MRLIILLLFLLFCIEGRAADDDDEHKNIIVLPANTIHHGDFFAIGHSIEISGEVTGDVYVCGTQVYIDGKVDGDVLAVGGSIEISGEILNNIRVIGGQITLSGHVRRNATIIAGNASLFPPSKIEGNLVCMAGNVHLASEVGSNATVVASNLRLSQTIRKNLNAYVGQMHLTSRARVGGILEYASNSAAWIESGAIISGQTIHHPSFVGDLLKGSWLQGLLLGSRVAALLMNFLYTFVVGWILIKLFPQNLQTALYALNNKTLKSISYGVLILFLLPLISLILLMTILGAPFALTLLALNVIGFYTAKVYSIIWTSNWIFKKTRLRQSKLPVFFLGLIIYFIVTAIPWIGPVIALAAMLFGLGAAIIAASARSEALQKLS